MTTTPQRLRRWALTPSFLVLLASAGCFDPSGPTSTGGASPGSTGVSSEVGGGGSTSTRGGEADSDATGASDETQGSDTSSMPTGQGEDATGGETSGQPSSCSEACVPETLQGPYVVLSALAGEALVCPAGWEADQTVLHRDLNVPTSTCSCSCGGAESFTCPAAEVENHFDAGCGSPGGTTLLPVDECVNVSAFSYLPEFTETPTEVSCAAVEDFEIPTTSWDTDVLLCRAETSSGGCGADETCVAQRPADADVCAVLEGDVPCPEGPYSARSVVYGDVDDSRSCSPACECDGSGTCGPSLQFWGSSGCAGAPSTSITFESCVTTAFSSARYSAQLLNPSCEPSDPVPAGTAEPSAAQTLCCLP